MILLHISLHSEAFRLIPVLRIREVLTPSRLGIIFSRVSDTFWYPTSYCNVDGIRNQRLADELNVSIALIGQRITFLEAVLPGNAAELSLRFVEEKFSFVGNANSFSTMLFNFCCGVFLKLLRASLLPTTSLLKFEFDCWLRPCVSVSILSQISFTLYSIF